MQLREKSPDQPGIDVWFVELTASAAWLERCLESLSADEKERASQFRFAQLKSDFTLSRGTLRALLGRYLAIEPGDVRFAYGPHGKPRMAFPETPLRFNLAHSGRIAVFAFAAGCEVGVDIEEVRPVRDQEAIVRRFFSPEEGSEWLALDAAERDEGFFRCWTRKEAYIKALGGGLSIPLDSFRVSLRREVPASLIHVSGEPAAASKWSMFSLAPAEGYIGALAVPECNHSVSILPRLTAAAVLELGNDPDCFPPRSL